VYLVLNVLNVNVAHHIGPRWRPMLARDSVAEVKSSVSTWMGDRQGSLRAANLCPFVGVDLNL